MGPREALFVFRKIPAAESPWPARTRIISWSPYDWRVVAGPRGELVASFSVVTGGTFAIKGYDSLDEIVRDAELRWCRPDTHVLLCDRPLAGHGYTQAGRVIIRVRDTPFLRQLDRLGLEHVHLVSMLLDLYTWTDSVPLVSRSR